MKPELLPLAVIIMTSAIMPARAQTPPGTTISLAVPLTGTSFANAELFQTNVSGGGLNGPGAAQVTLHLIDVKPNWDNTTLPATGEVDALQIEIYQGGPAGADSSGSTSDTSAEIINAHNNNNNGFANVLEGQADQYTPGQSGAPVSQIDVQLGGITSGSNGGVGLAAIMTLIRRRTLKATRLFQPVFRASAALTRHLLTCTGIIT